MIESKNPLVFVMRAREITEAIDSIRALPYSKVWIEYHWEEEIEKVFPSILDAAIDKGYTHISIFSDDASMSVESAQLVLDTCSDENPATSGWCNVNEGPLTNIPKSKLKSPVPHREVYKTLYTIKEIVRHPNPLFETWMTGNSFHTMSVDLWKRFPFGVYPPMGKHIHGICSDYHLCWRLQQAGIKMTVVRDARITHFKGAGFRNIRKVLCGVRPKNILWDEI